MTYLINLLKGAVIGIANAVPGVSGGTMAVILKVYDRLIGALSLSIAKLKKNWLFLLTIGMGGIFGVLIAAKILTFLFDRYDVATPLFFMGIIIGSIPLIYKETTAMKKPQPINIIPFVIGFGLMLTLSLINADAVSQTVQAEVSFGLMIKLFIYIFISAIAMIIPGISGSFVLLILGGYEITMNAINDLNIKLLIPIVLGAALGILAGAKLISIVLKKYHEATYFVILGLVIGSLYGVFPKNFEFNVQGIVGIILALVGIVIALLPQIIKKIKQKNV